MVCCASSRQDFVKMSGVSVQQSLCKLLKIKIDQDVKKLLT